jgi:hypothetical protein
LEQAAAKKATLTRARRRRVDFMARKAERFRRRDMLEI